MDAEQKAREFVARSHKGVLATLKRDGRPQLSNISYLLDDDGRIKISTTRTRAKAHNVRRDPRVSLSVQTDNWFEYLVVEGTGRVDEEDVLPKLRHIYERIRGEAHPNWQEFDEAMLREQRVVVEIAIERFYPLGRFK